MNPPQVDEFLPKQWLRYLGAGKTFAGRARFYFSYPQFLMISVVFYYESRLIQSYFPNIYGWVAALVALGLVSMAFEYVVVYPSEVIFNRGQNEREGRSPTYDKLLELESKVDALAGRADGAGAADASADSAEEPNAEAGSETLWCPTCDADGKSSGLEHGVSADEPLYCARCGEFCDWEDAVAGR